MVSDRKCHYRGGCVSGRKSFRRCGLYPCIGGGKCGLCFAEPHAAGIRETDKGYSGVLNDEVISQNWEDFSEKDYKKISESGYLVEDYEKMYVEQDEIFQSLFFMDEGISPMKAKEAVWKIFKDPECGQVFRIKGFLKDKDAWQELNATAHELTMQTLPAGQDVLIVIGEQMNEEKIRGYLKK